MHKNRVRFLGVFLIVAMWSSLPGTGLSQTRLGLHVTQEELNIWKQRAISGPYRVANDAGATSTTPGDWSRIASNKGAFMSNQSGEIWAGYTGTGCVPSGLTSIEPNSLGMKVRDAAFFALVQNDSSVKSAVLSYLLKQITQSGANFSNTGKWCISPDSVTLRDSNPGFSIAEWLVRILYAYDYIRPTVNSTDRAKIDAWFLGAANYMRHADRNLVKDNYGDSESNWLSGTLVGNGISRSTSCGGSFGQTHINGNNICGLGHWFNNRRAQMTSFYTQVGIMLNDSSLKEWGKRWFKEYLKYAVYPDSAPVELYRSHNTNDAQGWQYSGATFGKMLDIADTFARTGDMELFNFTTTAGGGAAGTAKSLKTAAQFFYLTTEGKWLIYNWNTSISKENLIDGVWLPDGGYYAYDTYLAKGNIFWRDSNFTAAYANPGATNKQGQTSIRNPDVGWMGSGKAHPGLLFMFGKMEGKVWPYPVPGQQPVVTNSLATSSTLVAHSKNFANDRGPDNLWDGDTAKEEGSAGNIGITSFWLEFDFRSLQNLTKARLFGDTQGTWVCQSWKFEHKQNLADSYTAAFTAPCNGNQWFEKAFTNTNARYVKVTVFGDSTARATQARELEIYGSGSGSLTAPSQLEVSQAP